MQPLPSPPIPASAQDETFACLQRVVDLTINMVLTFDGQLEHARLEKAMKALVENEVVLGCRLVENFWRCRWEIQPEEDGGWRCPLVETDDPAGATRHWLETPLEPTREAALQACLVHSKPGEGDVLLLKTSHIAADGTSILTILRKIAALYTHGGENTAIQPAAADASERGGGWLLRHLRLSEILTGLRAAPPRLVSPPIPPSGKASGGKRFVSRLVEAGSLHGIKKQCQETGIPYSDFLLAALFRAFFQVRPVKPGGVLGLHVPVDLRRLAPAAETPPICNLSGTIQISLGPQPGENLVETARRVQAAMLHHRRRYPGLSAGLLMQMVMAAGYAPGGLLVRSVVGRAGWPAGLTNLGPIDPAGLMFGSLNPARLVIYPPVDRSSGLFFLTHGYNGATSLTTGYFEGVYQAEMVEEVMERMVEEIQTAAERCGSGTKKPGSNE